MQPYVFDFLRELARHSAVYYMADGELDPRDVDELLSICKGAWGFRHGKYDFGSYSELAKNFVGWDEISKYDELIFVNDSCFCVQSFSPVFRKMDIEDCDAWCLLATDENNKDYPYTLEEYLRIPSKRLPLFCFGSYFLAFRKSVFTSSEFQKFIDSVKKEKDRLDVCIRYEMGLTKFLRHENYKLSAFVKIVYRNVTIYDAQAFRLLKKEFPLIKIRTFRDNPLSIPNLEVWPYNVARYVGNNKIFNYLKQIGYALTDSRKAVSQSDCLECDQDIVSGFHGEAARQLAIAKAQSFSHIVIFFNVSRDTIGGGMLSINRFVQHSNSLASEYGFNVMMSGIPFDEPEVDYSKFEQAAPLVHFSRIVENINPDRLILNIPEFYIPVFFAGLTDNYRRWLSSIPYLQINIMDQNHDYFPDRYYIECCRELTDHVTITTAHARYSTQELASSTDCPVLKLTPFLPEFYRTAFDGKLNIIAVSPDEEGMPEGLSKADVLDILRAGLPEYKIEIINNMTLEEYKRLISLARFTITFGEGFDGYYLEPFLSDSNAFAVYNNTFFPQEFATAPTIYQNWRELAKNIVGDIRRLESDREEYNENIVATNTLIRKYIGDEISTDNLNRFYRNQFDYLPDIDRVA
ncbi:rhamnan synthesis F family protein [Paraburkholderia silvatlantica]|uniref:rhamnan synthesis F family protein n=1 Tax=Paraburkholderia silvatlantica TaxID=321895 RepID=UPI003752DB34